MKSLNVLLLGKMAFSKSRGNENLEVKIDLRQKNSLLSELVMNFFLENGFFSFIQIVLNKTKAFKYPNYSIKLWSRHYLTHQLIWS
mgnify:CR=1 FL=1